MAFTDWLGLAVKENSEISQIKIEEQSFDMGGMASGNLSAAAEKRSGIIDQKECSSKMMIVQDGVYYHQVTEYAVRMARRLGCGIIVLDISDKPLQFSGDRKIQECDHFIEKARKSGEQFIAQAKTWDIQVTHVMDIGNTDEIIARMRKHDTDIRYMLMLQQPDPATSEQEQSHNQVPVVALHCLQP